MRARDYANLLDGVEEQKRLRALDTGAEVALRALVVRVELEPAAVGRAVGPRRASVRRTAKSRRSWI